jgi:hypothetical protein
VPRHDDLTAAMAAPAVASFAPETVSAPINEVGRGDAPRGGRGRGRGGGSGAASGPRAGAGAPIPEGPGVFRVKSETSAKSLSGGVFTVTREIAHLPAVRRHATSRRPEKRVPMPPVPLQPSVHRRAAA